MAEYEFVGPYQAPRLIEDEQVATVEFSSVVAAGINNAANQAEYAAKSLILDGLKLNEFQISEAVEIRNDVLSNAANVEQRSDELTDIILAGTPGVNDAMVGTYVVSGPNTQAALTKRYGPATIPEAAQLLTKLSRGLSDAVITVLGDSTGQGDFELSRRWPLRFITSLAEQFPAYTVNFYMWNSGAVDYDPPVTIQTGTGARKFDVYNGSASGMATGYSLENFETLSPATPDVVLISHGHNQSMLAFPDDYIELPQKVRRTYPGVPVVLIGQNPRKVGDSGYVAQRERVQGIAQYAAKAGYGFIDVMSRFELDPDIDTTLMADGTHPSPAGYEVWANEVMRRFQPDPAAPSYGALPKQDHLFYPAHVFEPKPVGASKSIGSAAYPTSGWAMDPNNSESVIGWVSIPYDWPDMNTFVYWTTHDEGTGNAVWGLFTFPSIQLEARPLDSFPVPRTALTATARGRADSTNVAAGETEYIRRARFPWNSATPYLERGLHGLRIQRIANTGTDTLNVDAVFLGIGFERV